MHCCLPNMYVLRRSQLTLGVALYFEWYMISSSTHFPNIFLLLDFGIPSGNYGNKKLNYRWTVKLAIACSVGIRTLFYKDILVGKQAQSESDEAKCKARSLFLLGFFYMNKLVNNILSILLSFCVELRGLFCIISVSVQQLAPEIEGNNWFEVAVTDTAFKSHRQI